MTDKTTEQSAASLFQMWAETALKQSKGNCTPKIATMLRGAAIMAERCATEMRERVNPTITDRVSDKEAQFFKDMMRASLQMAAENINGNSESDSG